MAVQEYLDARKRGQGTNAALLNEVMKAYTNLLDNFTTPAGDVDVSRLAESDEQNNAAKQFQHLLTNYAKRRFQSSLDDELELGRMTFGLFGFGAKELTTYLEEQGDRLARNPLALFGYLNENTAFGYMQRRNITEVPKMALRSEDAQEVVEATKTVGRVDPAKLTTIDQLAELLAAYADNEGAVSGDFLRGKPYVIKDPQGRIILPNGGGLLGPDGNPIRN